MTDPTTRLALTALIASAISHCEREIAEMNRSVRGLDKDSRQRIEATYKPGQQWRGLATDDFTHMVDELLVLTDGAITFGEA